MLVNGIVWFIFVCQNIVFVVGYTVNSQYVVLSLEKNPEQKLSLKMVITSITGSFHVKCATCVCFFLKSNIHCHISKRQIEMA